jgi:hypothetical protein
MNILLFSKLDFENEFKNIKKNDKALVVIIFSNISKLIKEKYDKYINEVVRHN